MVGEPRRSSHLARAAPDSTPSWLGVHERYKDTVMVLAGFLYVTLIGVIPVWVCVAYLVVFTLLLLRFRSIALLTALEAPLTALIPILAFWLAPLWGWIFVAWGLVALVLDRRRLWVRLRILWDDLRRVRGVTEEASAQFPPSDQVGSGSERGPRWPEPPAISHRPVDTSTPCDSCQGRGVVLEWG